MGSGIRWGSGPQEICFLWDLQDALKGVIPSLGGSFSFQQKYLFLSPSIRPYHCFSCLVNLFFSLFFYQKKKVRNIFLGPDTFTFFPPSRAVETTAVPKQSWHLFSLSLFTSDPDQSQRKDGKGSKYLSRGLGIRVVGRVCH